MTVESTRARKAPSIPSDVLRKVNQRDQEALGVLFDAHYDRLFSLAFHMVGERTAAEDVCQEVFLRVYRAAHQLDPERDPGPWLTTITANLCREKWRSKAGRQDKRTVSMDAEPERVGNLPKAGPGPDAEAQGAEHQDILRKAVACLPEAMRLVIVLHDLQGLSHEEISKIVGEGAPTVRKRYSRALQKLRDLLPESLV